MFAYATRSKHPAPSQHHANSQRDTSNLPFPAFPSQYIYKAYKGYVTSRPSYILILLLVTREQFEAWFADFSRSWLFMISDTEYWCGDWTCRMDCYTHSYMTYFESGDTDSENEEECEWEIGKCAIRAASGHMCDGVKQLEEDKLFREDQISKVIVPEKALGSGDFEGEMEPRSRYPQTFYCLW